MQLEHDYPDDLQVVYRHFPLTSIHDKAALSAQASEAAGLQGKFWELYDDLYNLQPVWSPLPPAGFESWVEDWAAENGLDTEQFIEDLNSEALTTQVTDARDFAIEAGLSGTPALLINGLAYGGPLDYTNLNTIIRLLIHEENQFTECPEMVIDPEKEYIATLETSQGDIQLLLYPEVAPVTVNSFVFLANQGWYDGIPFHRVVPGFVAQSGDPSATGLGGPGYTFDSETDPEIRFDRPGILGMANSGPNSNGSQFFITQDAQPDLNGSYTIFGEVVSGIEVVQSLAPQNPQGGADQPDADLILQVTIEER